MPSWLLPTLKWGGIALAVIFAIALITAGGPVNAPVALYWVLLAAGAILAIVGFVLERNRSRSQK